MMWVRPQRPLISSARENQLGQPGRQTGLADWRLALAGGRFDRAVAARSSRPRQGVAKRKGGPMSATEVASTTDKSTDRASGISDREQRQVEQANASGRTPVVFIHGLWLLPSSWNNWTEFFKEGGYAPLTPDWPDDPETVEGARAEPEVLAKKTLGEVADHTTGVIEALDKKPAVMGHSTGGLLAQMLAGRGLSAATVAID